MNATRLQARIQSLYLNPDLRKSHVRALTNKARAASLISANAAADVLRHRQASPFQPPKANPFTPP